uniref:E3 UFM1-protein ligase 1 n=1 Tax=Eptatretus burgeri TaxID=7764 RepID=A0A8C4PZX5_EPTBU
MASWEEIQRLAADFQLAQLGSATHRLAERNCVELLGLLTASGRIQLLHSVDGRDVITPAALAAEILDTLAAHGGRLELPELQKLLAVDLSHITTRVTELCRRRDDLQLVAGQLMNDVYMDRLADEVWDRLSVTGRVSTGELCRTYSLPRDFVVKELWSHLVANHGVQLTPDGEGFVTGAFAARQRAKARGVLSALTRSTLISNLVSRHNLDEDLFTSVMNELVMSSRLAGTISSSQRQLVRYTPNIFSQCQAAWVDSCLHLNGYLDYEDLRKAGVADPEGFLHRRYLHPPLTPLISGCLGDVFWSRADAEIEESLSSDSWIDVLNVLPPSFTEQDTSLFLRHWMQRVATNCGVKCSAAKRGVQASCPNPSDCSSSAVTTPLPSYVVILDRYIVSQKFLTRCLNAMRPSIVHRVRQASMTGPSIVYSENDFHAEKQANSQLLVSHTRTNEMGEHLSKKDQRRKKAQEGPMSSGKGSGGGGGGGRGVREVRTRKAKRKVALKVGESVEKDTEDDGSRSNVITNEEVIATLLADIPGLDDYEEFVAAIAEELTHPLAHCYEDEMTAFRATICRPAVPSSEDKEDTIDVAEELTNAYTALRAFDQSASAFDDDIYSHISRHLLRTLGNEATALLFAAMGPGGRGSQLLSTDARFGQLACLPKDLHGPLTRLNNAVGGKSVTEYLICLDEAAQACGYRMHKIDHKREKLIWLRHEETLREQLSSCDSPPEALRLAVTLLAAQFSKGPISVPPRAIPRLLADVVVSLGESERALLFRYRELVTQQLNAEQGRAASQVEVYEELGQLLPALKALALCSPGFSGDADRAKV